ncbi:MAG: hypothetical protein JXA68_10095 [Ignavibacteriales bacterium]|nr:hypothetical protein [Ignavibacteriales bacterium]
MIKNISLTLIFFICTTFINGQNVPKLFKIEGYQPNLESSETQLSNSISDILIVGDTIWLGTSRGLSRSTNNGSSWTNFYGTYNYGEESISAIGYYNGIIFVATAFSEEINNQDVSTGGGIRFSTDNGTSWDYIPQPLDEPDDSIIIYGVNNIRALPITVPQQNIIYDIAFTPNTIWITSWSGCLRKCNITNLIANPDTKWERVVLPPDYLSEISPDDILTFSLQPQSGSFGPEAYLNHVAFSVISTDDTTLYVGTANGINKSTDGGVSWKKFNHTNQDYPISGDFITALAYDTLNSSIWASTWKAEGSTEFYGLSSTFDGGATWQTFLPEEKPHNMSFKYYSKNSEKKSDVLVATDNGLFRSSDTGISWSNVPPIKDDITKISINTYEFLGVNTAFKSSSLSEIWIGSGNGLVKTTETANDFWNGSWKVFIASQPLESNTDTYAFPNPFSPEFEQVKLIYNTNNKTTDVTIRIFDFGMNLVRTLIQNAERSAGFDQIEYWDGHDENGKIVPNGVYFYRIDIHNDTPIFGKIMVLR